jgi:hypothetical protein
MPPFVLHRFISRCPVEERDDGLYVAGVRFRAGDERVAFAAAQDARQQQSLRLSGLPLSEPTLDRIDDALTAEAQAAGSNMPVGLSSKARLHRCVGCGAPFIAPPSARLCSDECRDAGKRESRAREIAKRSQRRNERRAALNVECRQCGKPVEGPSRSTRGYCSNACRQAAYRERAALDVRLALCRRRP